MTGKHLIFLKFMMETGFKDIFPMTGKHLIFLKFMETGFIHKCGRDLCSLIKVYAIFIHRHRLLSTARETQQMDEI